MALLADNFPSSQCPQISPSCANTIGISVNVVINDQLIKLLIGKSGNFDLDDNRLSIILTIRVDIS